MAIFCLLCFLLDFHPDPFSMHFAVPFRTSHSSTRLQYMLMLVMLSRHFFYRHYTFSLFPFFSHCVCNDVPETGQSFQGHQHWQQWWWFTARSIHRHCLIANRYELLSNDCSLRERESRCASLYRPSSLSAMIVCQERRQCNMAAAAAAAITVIRLPITAQLFEPHSYFPLQANRTQMPKCAGHVTLRLKRYDVFSELANTCLLESRVHFMHWQNIRREKVKLANSKESESWS